MKKWFSLGLSCFISIFALSSCATAVSTVSSITDSANSVTSITSTTISANTSDTLATQDTESFYSFDTWQEENVTILGTKIRFKIPTYFSLEMTDDNEKIEIKCDTKADIYRYFRAGYSAYAPTGENIDHVWIGGLAIQDGTSFTKVSDTEYSVPYEGQNYIYTYSTGLEDSTFYTNGDFVILISGINGTVPSFIYNEKTGVTLTFYANEPKSVATNLFQLMADNIIIEN